MNVDYDAERSVLGAILLDNKAYDEAAGLGLLPEDFTFDAHRRIFLHFIKLAVSSSAIDMITATESLHRSKELQAVGDVAYISSLVEGVPDRPSIRAYVKIVKERAARRKLLSACSTVGIGEMASAEAMAFLTDQMLQIQTGSDDAPSKRAIEFSDATFGAWLKVAEGNSDLVGLPTGVNSLDMTTTGIRPQELWVVSGRTGDGKLMDVDEPIPTPIGFVRNGDLQDGDEVFGEDGQRYRIIKAHEAKLEPSFKVSFDDGTFTHVHAGHLWHTFTRSDRLSIYKRQNPGNVKGLVRTTEEIARSLRVGKYGHINHSVRLARPISIQVKHLPIDPYVLGVWLGDGTAILYDSYELQIRLLQLGVLGRKHIPNQYLWACEEQRLELLRGLMDTDGSIANDGQVEFCSTNKKLADGVYQLAASLGIKPTQICGRAKLRGRDCGPKYRVLWTSQLPCFKLPSKSNRIPQTLRTTQRWRYIVNIEPAGPRVMRCLTTSNSSGLYLFGKNFNVTHNTNLALQMTAANCREDIPVGVFSIEMPKESILHRLWAGEGQVDFNHIRFPRRLSPDVRMRIERAMVEVGKWPLHVVEESSIPLSKLIAKAKLMIRRESVRLIVVDYVQLVTAVGRDERERTTKVSKALQGLAKDTGVPVIALSQLSRPKDGNENNRPVKYNLKESGSLENDADVIVLIYRPVDDRKMKTGEDELIVDKQRSGLPSIEQVTFLPWLRFCERER